MYHAPVSSEVEALGVLTMVLVLYDDSNTSAALTTDSRNQTVSEWEVVGVARGGTVDDPH